MNMHLNSGASIRRPRKDRGDPRTIPGAVTRQIRDKFAFSFNKTSIAFPWLTGIRLVPVVWLNFSECQSLD